MYFNDIMAKIEHNTECGSSRVSIEYGSEGSKGLPYIVIFTDNGRIELFFNKLDDIYLFARTILNQYDELIKENSK